MDTTENDMTETLITLTSDIVAAHVSNNSVGVEDVPSLINNIYSALSGLGSNKDAKEARPEPAVPIRSSVKRDYIICLEDGKKMKMLKRHLKTNHGMTPDEYRQRWNLPSDYPMVAPAYAEKRRDLAKKIGLGRKPGQKAASTASATVSSSADNPATTAKSVSAKKSASPAKAPAKSKAAAKPRKSPARKKSTASASSGAKASSSTSKAKKSAAKSGAKKAPAKTRAKKATSQKKAATKN